MSFVDDKKIIELYFARDDSAINETKTKYGKLLYSVSYNILKVKEEAEECENDTYLSAWECIPPNNPQVLSAFLSRITKNISFKRLKSQTAQKRGGNDNALPLDELSGVVADSCNAISQLELTEILNAFLRQLPQRDRQVFICHYWYCDSIKDISRQFGFTQSKVKMILLRTRNKLLDHLKQEEVLV